MTSIHSLPMSAHMNMSGHGMAYPSYIDTNQSHHGGSVMSVDEHMDSATIDPRTTTFTCGSFNEMDFPSYDPNFGNTAFDGLGAAPHTMSPLSPIITSTSVDNTHTFLDSFDDVDVDSLVANAHAAPWNPAIPRSDPMGNPGSLQIPGAPKHQFMSMPNNFGGYSFDSAYVSGPAAPDTMSFASAPTGAMYTYNDDESDIIMDRPAKKAKKLFRCEMDGEHRTRDFANIHDLERHQRSTHGVKPRHSQPHYYRCIYKECRSKPKTWDRKDNFRSHIVRKHFHGRNDDKFKVQIDDMVKKSQITLSQVEIDRIFIQKQKQKEISRQSASKRRARKSSARLDTDAASRVRGSLGGMSGHTSAVASAVDDSEYAFGGASSFGDQDMMFSPDLEPQNNMPPTSYPVHMATFGMGSHLRPDMPRMQSDASHDLW
ncbi:hypothetical protein KVT40_005788 [Elsinoe batatas]|uniref:C2H2-type domain-containing protein n=1 Tax=Elsinoe batatas TaxID=2601811 RepID=A0A8K0L6X4_9PEZI|nr:hypothetical protein KVT40_005788 [Elsinoe batatas]